MRIKTSSGKYTFVKSPRSGFSIDILRYGEEWVVDADGANALHAIMCELDAARMVLATVRAVVSSVPLHEQNTIVSVLVKAMVKHQSLVTDDEPPTEWSK